MYPNCIYFDHQNTCIIGTTLRPKHIPLFMLGFTEPKRDYFLEPIGVNSNMKCIGIHTHIGFGRSTLDQQDWNDL